MRSLTFRVFFGYFVMICLLTLFIVVFLFSTVKRQYWESAKRDLERIGFLVADRVRAWEREGVLHERLSRLSKEMGVFVAVFGRGGKVEAGSWDLKERIVYVSMPVDEKRVLKLGLPEKTLDRLLSELRSEVLNISLVLVALAAILSYLFSRFITRPIRELSEASKRVAQGDFTVRVFEESKGEVKELTESFNYMVEKMEKLFKDLSFKKDELRSIISSMEDGLAVVDRMGKVVLNNRSFEEMVGEEGVEGKFYWEMIPDPRLGSMIKEALSSGEACKGEVRMKDRIFVCRVSPLKERDECVLVFQDVTEKRIINGIKRDLVESISHELKTPLTAIKGYVEALSGKVSPEAEGYLEVLRRNTERLIRIVEDLTALHEAERVGLLEVKEFDLGERVKDIVDLFKPKAEEKGIGLVVDAEDGVVIKGDPFKVDQVVFNLVENAVRYTDKGEVRVRVGKEGDFAVLEVEDTGIGIPKEHIPRIFERFYVVDKSRSRRLGGTGLGLSIVKHIVLLHGGSVDVESEVGKGSRFTVRFPLVRRMG